MFSNGLEPQLIVISNELVQFVSGAGQKYQDYLAKHKDKEKHLKLDQQKSTLLKEIDEVTSKRDQLDKICASLEADYVKFVEMAKSKLDLSYVSKESALTRKVVDVKNDIKRWKENSVCCKKNEKNYSLKTLNFYSTKNLTKSHIIFFSR